MKLWGLEGVMKVVQGKEETVRVEKEDVKEKVVVLEEVVGLKRRLWRSKKEAVEVRGGYEG